MATETKSEWTAKHVAAVKHIAQRDNESEVSVFNRVRYMITNHGRNMFNTDEDMSAEVEQALSK